MAFVGNVLGDPALNLVLVLVVVLCLLASKWGFHGIYKQWPLDILEAFFLINTGVLSAITLYFKFTSGNQTIATNVSIATALLVFAVIFVYHIYMDTSVVKLQSHASNWFKKMKQLRNSNRQHELDSLMTGTSCEDSDVEEVIVKPQAQVQPNR